ncbi:MAG: EscU/YscU/HrcU family type III secretion system export apparatus switch protein [Rhodospirillales bacterium]
MAEVENDETPGANRSRGAAKPLAVALRYQAGDDPAPRVVASGRGAVAERILAAAEEAGVPVCTDPDLAHLLAALDIDEIIPLEAFSAVAAILVALYRASGGLPAVSLFTPGPDAQADPSTRTEM